MSRELCCEGFFIELEIEDNRIVPVDFWYVKQCVLLECHCNTNTGSLYRLRLDCTQLQAAYRVTWYTRKTS